MTWFKVDDSFYDHPKVFDAPDCAVALWTRAGTWSARNLTNGFVPAGMPARLCDDPDTAVKELVRRGLWSRVSGGYQFHDWKVYQPSSEEVTALRAKRAEAGRKGGLAKAAKQTASKPVASARQVAKQNATPTRPEGSVVTVGTKGDLSVTRAREEPPSKCLEHQHLAKPPPCGPCADARRAADAWQAQKRARLDEAPKCRIHRGQPAHNCGPCRADALATA